MKEKNKKQKTNHTRQKQHNRRNWPVVPTNRKPPHKKDSFPGERDLEEWGHVLLHGLKDQSLTYAYETCEQ